MLKELYFAFNLVQNESQLIPAVTTNKSLTYLVITGNPFAVNQQHNALEVLFAEKYSRGGELVNEALNPPNYLRSAKTTTHQAAEEKQQNMFNYGLSKGLIQVQDPNTYNGQDPFVLSKPLAL